MAKIGVGLIGANPDRGWALDAHIPALATSDTFELVAVSTSSEDSARRAGDKFGVPAFANAADLANHPAVDLVVVSVRIPLHRELVGAAIAAGKMVLCEWSLGAGLEETVALAEAAERAGVRGFVGLQARAAPAYRHVRNLLDTGFVGEVLSSTIVASGGNWGPWVQPENAYILDARSEAGMLVIPFGHTMEGVCYCLGEVEHLSAELATRRKTSIEAGTDRIVPITVPDQIAVAMKLHSGAVLSAHFRGGMSAGLNFHWEINGTEGDIVVTGPYGLTEMCELSVSGAKTGGVLAALPTPPEFMWAPGSLGTPANPAYNVAQAYGLLAQDLADGGSRMPTFADAVRRSRMIAAVETAAKTGMRQTCL